MKRKLQLLVAFAIGAGALWLALKDVQWARFFETLGQLDLGLVLLGTLAFFVMHLLRTLRWGVLISGVKSGVGFRSYFSICSIGFFLINILPFRLGEFVRPYLLLDREKVPFGSGMATVIVERCFDLGAVGGVFIFALIFASMPPGEVVVAGVSYDTIALARGAMLGVLLPATAAMAILLAMGERGVALSRRVFGFAGERVAELAGRFVQTFLEALRSLKSPSLAAKIVGLTAAAWLLNVWSIQLLLNAFPFGAALGYWDCAAILACVCVGLMVPAPPGFAGVFELAVAIGLGIYGIGRSEAAAAAIVIHVDQLLVVGGLGALFLSLDRIRIGTLINAVSNLSGPAPDEAVPDREGG